MIRNYFLINTILLVVTGLLCFRLYEVWTQPSVISFNVPVSQSDGDGDMQKTSRKSGVRADSYNIITSNNLFHPSRSVVQRNIETQKPVSLDKKPQLFGTIIMANKKIAILEEPSTKKSRSYHINDNIAGFIISDILQNKVILQRGDQSVQIGLREDKKVTPVKQITKRKRTVRKKAQRRRRPRRVRRRNR